jgi:hypothetical protein
MIQRHSGSRASYAGFGQSHEEERKNRVELPFFRNDFSFNEGIIRLRGEPPKLVVIGKGAVWKRCEASNTSQTRTAPSFNKIRLPAPALHFMPN